jgi:hypothetical protein
VEDQPTMTTEAQINLAGEVCLSICVSVMSSAEPQTRLFWD